MCETFTWYGSFTEAMRTIPSEDDQARFARALVIMAETGEIPADIEYPISMTLAAIKPIVQNSVTAHRSGKAGGRPRKDAADGPAKKDEQDKVVTPTRKECEGYFKANGSPANQGRKFYEHYRSQGWKKSNGQDITDWHALADKWIGEDAEKEPKRRGKQPGKIPCAKCGAEAVLNKLTGLYTCSSCGQLNTNHTYRE